MMMMPTMRLLGALALAQLAAAASSTAVNSSTGIRRACSTPESKSYAFCDTALSPEARAADVVKRLKLEEKPDLMTGRTHATPTPPQPDCQAGTLLMQIACALFSAPLGARGPAGNPGVRLGRQLDPRRSGELRQALRYKLSAAGRHRRHDEHVPDPRPREHDGRGAAGAAARAQLRGPPPPPAGCQRRHLDTWAPNLNLNRDPRWGRNWEVATECPHLGGQIGLAYVTGFQTGKGEDSAKYHLRSITSRTLHQFATPFLGLFYATCFLT